MELETGSFTMTGDLALLRVKIMEITNFIQLLLASTQLDLSVVKA